MKEALITGMTTCLFMLAQSAHLSAQGNTGSGTQVPTNAAVLGTVSIPQSVLADGKPLRAGRYTLRLTAQRATAVPGVNPDLERWVEFVQGDTVKGRELASIVPAGDEKDTMAGPDMPGGIGRSGTRVEMLKGGEFLRIWIARADNDYLIHLPPQRTAK